MKDKWNKEKVQPLYDLYLSPKTLREVGDTINVTREYIRQLFKKFGFKTRGYTVSELVQNKIEQSRVNLPKEKLENEYVQQKLTLEEISKLNNVHQTTVYKYLQLHHIPLRSRSEAQILRHVVRVTQEMLYQAYIVEKKTAGTCGEQFQYSRANIVKLLRKYGIRKNPSYNYTKTLGRPIKNGIKLIERSQLPDIETLENAFDM